MDTFDGPVVVHSSGVIEYANDTFYTLLGFDSPADVVQCSLTEFVAEPYRDALASQFEQLSNGETSALALRLELETEDGDRQEFIAVSSPVTWEGTTQLQTTFVESRVDTEGDALRESAMHEAPIGITVADITREDEPLVYVNDAFVRLTGYPRSEVLGQNCRFLQGEATREEPVAAMRAAIDAGDSVTVELRNYRKDGSMFWNRVTLSPLEDETGTVTHFLGYQEDVSEKKVYEREKTLFERYAGVSDQMMFVTDSDGTIEYANPAFERVTGYSAIEAIGENPRIFKSGQHEEPFYEELWETITAGDVWEGEVTNRTKFGELYRVHQRIVPVVDNRDKITHFVAIHRDVTDERLTQQVLDVLDRVFRHNVRSSLTVIHGFTEIIEPELDQSKHQTALQAIRERTSHLNKISEQLTTIRQILQAKQSSSPLELRYVETIVTQAQDTYDDAVITLTMETSGDRAVTNGTILELALETAIDNAVIHCDQETPTVDITIRDSARDDTVLLDIADNGPGIPEWEWNIVESGVETPLEHTSGVGLWILYWSVISLGGTVERAPNEPRGTVLTLEVPLVPASD